MADNVILNPGVGGAVIASDEVAGAQYQRVKLTLGADGVDNGDLALANPMPVIETRPSTAALANIAGSVTNVTLIASNAARRGASIFNDSTSALYIKYGATASTSSFTVKVNPGGYFEVPQPCYTGIVDGIWDSATGTARVTEV